VHGIDVVLSCLFASSPQIRNLALGLAARGVDWKAHGYSGSMSIAGRLSLRLFDNLFHRWVGVSGMKVAETPRWEMGAWGCNNR
jgi:hypothetical protein